MLPILIREPRNSDHAFVHDTFRRSYHLSLGLCPCCTPPRDAPPDRRSNRHRDLLKQALATYPTWVACDPEEPDTIYGVLIGDASTVAWAYVVHGFRRQHVLTRLAAHVGLEPVVRVHFPTEAGWLWAQARGVRLVPTPMKDPTP